MGATQERLTAKLEPLLDAGPTLPKLLDALGWQGGTVADALAEVRRLVDVKTTALFYTEGWEDADHLDPEMAKLAIDRLTGLNDLLKLKSQPKPLGQGVAALLPEHGEVKL
jgi:hypothetical protein